MNEALDVNVSNDHHDLLVVKEEWKGKRSSKENDRYGGRKIECLAVEVLEQAAHGGLCAVCGGTCSKNYATDPIETAQHGERWIDMSYANIYNSIFL